MSLHQKSSTPPGLSQEECVFPDLVECTTPVEQILPSLATSRWSRGLGHVVHAQNIRTVGNLSALTKDQVEKLPIRSPKVSTLRRVLRIFNENRTPKSSKVSQLRAIKEDAEEMESEEKLLNRTSKLAESQTTSDDTEERRTSTNNTGELSTKEAVAATPSSSVQRSNERMLTPKRSRAIVKPVHLFESIAEVETEKDDMETESEDVFENEMDTAVNEANQQHVKDNTIQSTETESEHVLENEMDTAVNEANQQHAKDNTIQSTEKKTCVIKSSMDVEETEKDDPPSKMIVEDSLTEEEIISALDDTIDVADIVHENELQIEPSAKMDVQEVGYELKVDDMPGTVEQKQENPEMPVNDSPVEEQKQETPDMIVENSPTVEEQKQENPVVKDVPSTEESKPESPDMIVEDSPESKERGNQAIIVEELPLTQEVNQEIPVEELSSTQVLQREDQDIPVQELPVTEEPKQENPEITVHTTEEQKQENPETTVEDELPTEEYYHETAVEDPAPEEFNNKEIIVNDSVPVEDTIDPFAKTTSDLLTLKSQQELNELPLELLLSCQEQLMTILSNTTTAIRLKCSAELDK